MEGCERAREIGSHTGRHIIFFRGRDSFLSQFHQRTFTLEDGRDVSSVSQGVLVSQTGINGWKNLCFFPR